MQSKASLRKHYKTRRNALTLDQVEDLSIAIANQLITLPIWEYEVYHIFLPIEEQKEINTTYILSVLSGKDKNIAVSKSNFETGTMTHFLLTDGTSLKKNGYNIPEPVSGIPVDDQTIDVVFVPLLAFDEQGHRVGYGKGFYDKFLSKCRPGTLKIGLSFFKAETVITDVFDGDIALDYCVTPERIYKF